MWDDVTGSEINRGLLVGKDGLPTDQFTEQKSLTTNRGLPDCRDKAHHWRKQVFRVVMKMAINQNRVPDLDFWLQFLTVECRVLPMQTPKNSDNGSRNSIPRHHAVCEIVSLTPKVDPAHSWSNELLGECVPLSPSLCVFLLPSSFNNILTKWVQVKITESMRSTSWFKP